MIAEAQITGIPLLIFVGCILGAFVCILIDAFRR